MNIPQVILWDEVRLNVRDAEELVEIRREILPRIDPFTFSDEKFVRMFRLTKPVCQDLINMVTPFMQEALRGSALTIKIKVLASLRFFASGSYQEITGSNNFVAISQASMSRCVKEVCNALNQPALFNAWVYFPRNLDEMQDLRSRFYEKFQFPGIVGCVDCTHVGIIAPPRNDPDFPEHVYINRKNYHSINVQLICDDNLKIMNVNAQFPGSAHDANIWRHSQVSELMETIYRHDPRNVFYLLGDSGYPTRPWLLTPIPNPIGEAQERFNTRFCSIRSLIERCNGVLKNRFRCLLKHRILHYSPTMASQIINSCVILHNMCIANNIVEPYPIEVENIDYGMYAVYAVQDHAGRINPDLVAARQLRQNVMNNL